MLGCGTSSDLMSRASYINNQSQPLSMIVFLHSLLFLLLTLKYSGLNAGPCLMALYELVYLNTNFVKSLIPPRVPSSPRGPRSSPRASNPPADPLAQPPSSKGVGIQKPKKQANKYETNENNEVIWLRIRSSLNSTVLNLLYSRLFWLQWHALSHICQTVPNCIMILLFIVYIIEFIHVYINVHVWEQPIGGVLSWSCVSWLIYLCKGALL